MTIEALKKEVVHPAEVLELYGPVLEKVTFLNNFTKVEPGINQNQLEALDLIMATIVEFGRRNKGVTIADFGPMFSGKTVVLCLLAKELEGKDFKVYKHQLDLTRTGPKLVNQTGDIWTEADLYESISDIDKTKEILLIDEFQFNTVDNADAIKEFLQKRKEAGLVTVISKLDFNYRRDPWKTTRILLPHFNQIFVLRARCEDCGGLAQFPQRNIKGAPAHVDAPEILVGAEEYYQSKCGRCHEVGGKPKTVYV